MFKDKYHECLSEMEKRKTEILRELDKLAYDISKQYSFVDKETLKNIRSLMEDYYNAFNNMQKNLAEYDTKSDETHRAFINRLEESKRDYEKDIRNYVDSYIMNDYTRESIYQTINELAPYSIVQETGDREDLVMSQKATTDFFNVFIDAEYTTKKDLGLTFETGYRINIENGQNDTLSESEVDKYYCSNYRKFIEPVKISLPSDEYEYIVWCYSNYSHTHGTYTPMKEWLRNKSVIITNKDNTTHFRICVRRTDGTSITNDLEKINGLLAFHLTRVSQNFGTNDKAVMSQKSISDAFSVSVSGDDIVLYNAADMPLNSVLVRGKTIQDGIPEPNSPITISGTGDDGFVTVTGVKGSDINTCIINLSNALYGNSLIADVIDLSNGVIIKKFGKRHYDGTENWVAYSGTAGVYYLDDTTTTANGSTMEYASMVRCSHFAQTSNNTLSGHENALRFQQKTKSQRVYISCDQFATVEALKSFLSAENANGNPVTIVYPLYTEERINLTETEIENFKVFNNHYPYATLSVDGGILDVNYTINSVQYFIKDESVEPVSSDTPQEFFVDEINETVATVKKACEKKSFTFVLVTDSHYPASTNWRNTIKNIKELHKSYPVDAIFHLGDMIPGTIAKDRSIYYLEEMRDSLLDVGVPCFLLMGNHDDNTFYAKENPNETITQAEWYALTQRYNDIRVNRDGTNGYYYFDIDSFGVRVVCLHSHLGEGVGQRTSWGYTSEQIEWVRDVALDTNNQVIFFSHMPLTQSFTCYNYNIPGSAEMRTVIENFIENGGTVVGLFHGHNHWDFIAKANADGFNEVSTACSRDSQATVEQIGYMPNGAVAPARMKGTVTEDLWDVVVVQPNEKFVKMIRFGAGEDREFSYS